MSADMAAKTVAGSTPSARPRTMRDAIIGRICEMMKTREEIFFLSADFGAPTLDRLRADFSGRFINVGIAEQNLVNVSAGMAMEGCTVFAYLIAPFIMRAYEQIRINLALTSQLRPLNVNILAVGAGLSYDVAGPTHHCFEDISIMRTLPGVQVFSPADPATALRMCEHAVACAKPKYFRLDGKPCADIYTGETVPDMKKGFSELRRGGEACLVSTGIMTHRALELAAKNGGRAGVIDLFSFRPLDEDALARTLSAYRKVITLEEGFLGAAGLDGLISKLRTERDLGFRMRSFGFRDRYLFDAGSRKSIHGRCGLGDDEVLDAISSP